MVVTHSIFDSDFPNNILYDLQCPILNFDGSEIDMIEGYFRMTAYFNGQHCSTSIYVVNNSCEPVIGCDLLTRLGMTVKFGLQTACCTEPDPSTQNLQQSTYSSQPSSTSSNTSLSVSEGTSFCNKQVSPLRLNSSAPELDQIPGSVKAIVKQLPNLISKEIGTYPDGQHQIQLSTDTVPIAVKTRPIPYTI